jgi:membrane fusion protein (multidrug efflux system)
MNKHSAPSLLWPLLASLVLAAGCQKPAPSVVEKNDPLVRVSLITAQFSDFSETGLYYGKLAGTANATLITVLGGRVDSVLASEGSLVTAGQSLGRINAEKAQATLNMVALAEKIAKENLDRQRQFFKDGNASQISVDQAELAWLTAHNTSIDAQKALDGALAITPIAGTVTHRYVELYQELPPGSPTFAVSSIDTMKVTIGIPEPEMAGVAEGNAAEVTVDSFPGTIWKGRVSRLGREVSADTLTFAAEVTFDNPDHRLLPGTSATVNLHRRDLANRILVPSEAVLTQGQESFVMVEVDGVAHRVPVTLGPASKTRTVIAQGLKVGDHVIVAGNNLTSDGARVVTGENQ